MDQADRIEMRLICGADSLESVTTDWQGILDTQEEPSLMLSPAWLHRWRRHYGGNRELRVGQFFDGDECIGFAPLCLRTHNYLGGLRTKRLEFMGSNGQDDDSLGSDYLNLIAAAGREQEVAACFVQQLYQGAFGDWHECVLDLMNGESPLVEMMQAALADTGLQVELRQTTEAPYLPLAEDWDGYMARLSKSRRYWFRRSFRDFESYAGEEGYTLHTADDEASLELGMDILARLHAERWQAEGHEGAFASKRFHSFHMEFARQMLDEDRLQLAWLTIGEKPVAAQYNIYGKDKVYFYQSGRLMDTPPKVRLGVAMFTLTITDAMNKGYKEFDFLAGKDSYKYDFTDQVRPIVELHIASQSMRSKLVQSHNQALDLVRKTKRKLVAVKGDLAKAARDRAKAKAAANEDAKSRQA